MAEIVILKFWMAEIGIAISARNLKLKIAIAAQRAKFKNCNFGHPDWEIAISGGRNKNFNFGIEPEIKNRNCGLAREI